MFTQGQVGEGLQHPRVAVQHLEGTDPGRASGHGLIGLLSPETVPVLGLGSEASPSTEG